MTGTHKGNTEKVSEVNKILCAVHL